MACEIQQPVWNFEDYLSFIPRYGLLRDYLSYAIRCTDAPPQYHILAWLAITSNAIASTHTCLVRGEEIPLHMFILITGDSGTRKSAAIKRALRIVQPVYNDLRLGHRIWYPESCTPEGIIQGLVDDPNRLMVVSEWSELHKQSHASYAQHSSELFNLLYDQMPLNRIKMKTQIIVERPSVTILGASTPSLVKQATTLYDWQAGKMARFLIGYQAKPPDKEMDSAVEHPECFADLREKFGLLLAPSVQSQFILSDAAWDYKVWWKHSDRWKNFAANVPEHIMPSIHRIDDHIYRVATLYQATMDYPYNFVVGVDAMAAACEFVFWCMGEMIEHFALLPMHELAPLTRVRTVLQRTNSEGISRRDLLRKTHLHVKSLMEAIGTLVAREEVVVRPLGTGSIIYFYCPPTDTR